ncbi:MAG: hypothetical protein AAF483_20320 [Planctomycetota bacterium]
MSIEARKSNAGAGAKPAMKSCLQGLFDYAGLFPPAKLGMRQAVRDYYQQSLSPESWMQNRFVVAASRLGELLEALQNLELLDFSFELSLVVVDWDEDRPHIDRFQELKVCGAAIAAIETRDLNILDCKELPFEVYLEIPWDTDSAIYLARLDGVRQFAKLRSGGLTVDAFPKAEHVAAFLKSCHEAKVACKATAGLHHPIAALRPTCGETDAPVVEMHGFINVLLAAAATRQELPRPVVQKLLQAKAEQLTIYEADIRFEDLEFSLQDVIETRKHLFHSIGSCSFTEPVEDLEALGWLTRQ